MFNTQKFGSYLSRLRKKTDMTQSELAAKLAVTRQAISGYERGDSFPDVSILVLIADTFGVSLDELINSGEPTRGEALILTDAAIGRNVEFAENVSDILNLAPLLKPSVLGKLSAGLSKKGIDISNIVGLAEYLNDDTVIDMLENATFDSVSDELLGKLMPLLDDHSKGTIFEKILNGVMDWHLIRALVPYMDYMQSQIEAAVVEGALPYEALDLMHEGNRERWERERKNGEL